LTFDFVIAAKIRSAQQALVARADAADEAWVAASKTEQEVSLDSFVAGLRTAWQDVCRPRADPGRFATSRQCGVCCGDVTNAQHKREKTLEVLLRIRWRQIAS
jgi:hypothetical protein